MPRYFSWSRVQKDTWVFSNYKVVIVNFPVMVSEGYRHVQKKLIITKSNNIIYEKVFITYKEAKKQAAAFMKEVGAALGKEYKTRKSGY